MIAPFARMVCGVDFSPCSIAALDTAISIARVHHATVHVVHAYAIPGVPLVEPGIAALDERRVMLAIERELTALVGPRRDAGVPLEVRAALGWPPHALLYEAHRAHADVICVGTRGLTGLPRFLLGSVAERVARIAPVPVLVVPEPHADRPPRAISRVLCGVDFSEPSAIALRAAASLAAIHRAELFVVHAWEPPAFLARHPQLAVAHERELQRALDDSIQRALSGAPLPARICRGRPHSAIVEEARALAVDLLVLGSTGTTGRAELLLGSVVERALRLSPIPVLVTRGAGARR